MDPQEGSITFDGCDLRDISVEELRHRITVLFHQPVQYYAKVAVIIAYGYLESKPGETEIKTSANAAGADSIIDRLTDNYDTLLVRLFKGSTDLSVGEWQRDALARAFLRQAPIIVLDDQLVRWIRGLKQTGCSASGNYPVIVQPSSSPIALRLQRLQMWSTLWMMAKSSNRDDMMN